ncbi:MAG: LysR family transcriptional regulator [Burkholderiales bacterium]|nr:LysR family transcriptional regulator [Burkholderiales bacterium]
MNRPPEHALAVGTLRAFEAVARRLNFRAAAEELHLTQPAVSRQIRSLEGELGAPLFVRGTRHVELTGAGRQLLDVVEPFLGRLDATVRTLRSTARRRPVTVTTFPSFASLWLLPRMAELQQRHPDIDIRISAVDQFVESDDPEVDLGLRYCRPHETPPGSTLMFGEVLTPVASPALLARTKLRVPADLARHTLLEEDDRRPSAQFLNWRHWLEQQGAPLLEPRGWIYLNYTYQQIQAALAGQGVALARMALVAESLARGELVEPFGPGRRLTSPYSYWLVRWPARRERPALATFEHWLRSEAAATRKLLGHVEVADAAAAGVDATAAVGPTAAQAPAATNAGKTKRRPSLR